MNWYNMEENKKFEKTENKEINETKKNLKEVGEWILCILIAVILALLVRHYVFTPTVVNQISMDPTMKEGDRLFLNRWSITTNKEIKRGEIITFEAPTNAEVPHYNLGNPVAIYDDEPEGLISKFIYYVLEIGKQSYIKRVIGVAGDKVLIENGKVYINGEQLKEDYLVDGVLTERTGMYYDFVVPDGYVFAMGDNRPDSKDCRNFGCIPINKIESKVAFRFWPFSKFGKVD